MVTDYITDFETLNTVEKATLVEFSVIPFKMDIENPPTFQSLVESGKKIKFDLKHQKALGRRVSASTVEWWKSQGEAAKSLLKPSSDDKTLYDGYMDIKDWFVETGVEFKKSHIWTRGEMDIIWFRSWYCDAMDLADDDISAAMPVMFNNFREVRTAIEANMDRDVTYCPLPNGSLPGFVKHNSLHDCARDILMLIYSKRYAYGLEDIPTDVDPNSMR
ncbi:DNA primase [Aeromonas phage AS-zj]|uniref:DNA primase n=2 Tax=Ceceduovirus TaxID=2842588 RepID=A0A223LFI3_9CAUD|nr:exonuclease [Aeromonas phage AS-zj]YP_009834982.1 exonuclease [Aeromonas phage AS-sw]ASU00501.1 DNA primase [Aeromonas phage AS-zj]ATI18330.1 DNA exonuclease A [Aeromonas phage AS-sw]